MDGRGALYMLSEGASTAAHQRPRSAAAAAGAEAGTGDRAVQGGRLGTCAGGAEGARRPRRTGTRGGRNRVGGAAGDMCQAWGAVHARRSVPGGTAAAPPSIRHGAKLRIRMGCGRAALTTAAPDRRRRPCCRPTARPCGSGSAVPPGPAPFQDQGPTEGRAGW